MKKSSTLTSIAEISKRAFDNDIHYGASGPRGRVAITAQKKEKAFHEIP